MYYDLQGEHSQLHESMADAAPSPEEQIIEREAARRRAGLVRLALCTLDDSSRQVIERRKLLDRPQSPTEVGAVLGMTAAQVRRTEDKAMRTMSAWVRDRSQTLDGAGAA